MEYIKAQVRKVLSEKRYNHTLGVLETSILLAKTHGVSEERASLAAILHDYAKPLSYEDALKIVDDFGIILDEETLKSSEIIHGPIAAYFAKEKFNIEDEDVLNAIYYHTTGRENMSTLEKIIYLSDYIEPNRNFPGIGIIRELALQDLDKAVFLGMNNTIKYLIDRNIPIHTNTIKGRNYLLNLHKWR